MTWYDSLVQSAKKHHGVDDLTAFRERYNVGASTASVTVYFTAPLSPHQLRYSLLNAPLDCSGPFFTNLRGDMVSISGFDAFDPMLRDVKLHSRIIVSDSKVKATNEGVTLIQTARFKWIPQNLVYSAPMDALTDFVKSQLALLMLVVKREAELSRAPQPWVVRCPSLGWDRNIRLPWSDDQSFGAMLETLFALVLRQLEPDPRLDFQYNPEFSAEDLLKTVEHGTLFVVVPCQTWCMPGGVPNAASKTTERAVADLTTLRDDTWWMCNPNIIDFQRMVKIG